MKSKIYFYYYYFNKINEVNYYKNKRYNKLLINLSKQKRINYEEIKFICSKYKFDNFVLNWAMVYVSSNNHKELVDYFISKGAENSTKSNSRQLDAKHPISFDFNSAMGCASFNNHRDLVEYLKEKQREYNNKKK